MVLYSFLAKYGQPFCFYKQNTCFFQFSEKQSYLKAQIVTKFWEYVRGSYEQKFLNIIGPPFCFFEQKAQIFTKFGEYVRGSYMSNAVKFLNKIGPPFCFIGPPFFFFLKRRSSRNLGNMFVVAMSNAVKFLKKIARSSKNGPNHPSK